MVSSSSVPSDEPVVRAELSIGELWGVGRATRSKLKVQGIERVAELAPFSARELAPIVGTAMARRLYRIAHAFDDARVLPRRPRNDRTDHRAPPGAAPARARPELTPPALVQILLISGSLRSASTNTALLRTAAAVAPEGVTTVMYDGLDRLPHYNPDDDVEPLDPAVADLRAGIGAADAVLFSTPEYAGALPGSFKNVLDWSVGGGEIYGKPVAWINASAYGPTGAADAHDSLRKVLGYTGSDIVEAACVSIPIPRSAIGDDGLISDPALRDRIAQVLTTLAAHVDRRIAPDVATDVDVEAVQSERLTRRTSGL